MRHSSPVQGEEDEVTYAIHEVYYDKDGNVEGWTKEPTGILSEERNFDWVLKRLADAVKKPTLDYKTGKEIVDA